MTDADLPPPRLTPWVACPVCQKPCKTGQGRGGHIHHTQDAAHAAYRAAHPDHLTETWDAAQAPPSPEEHNAAPAAPTTRPANVEAPPTVARRPALAQQQTLPGPDAAQVAAAPASAPAPGPAEATNGQATLDHPWPAASAPAQGRDWQKDVAVWSGLGLSALALYRLVQSKKGAKARQRTPLAAQAPPDTAAPSPPTDTAALGPHSGLPRARQPGFGRPRNPFGRVGR